MVNLFCWLSRMWVEMQYVTYNTTMQLLTKDMNFSIKISVE